MPETLEMMTIEAAFDFSRWGRDASTACTVCIMSTSNSLRQLSSLLGMASALTLATRMSRPPSSPAAASIQPRSAAPSATSSARPVALTPVLPRAATAAVTSYACREQMATLQPSAAIVSAIARPMPLVPPVISAFRLRQPRSIAVLPLPGALARSIAPRGATALPGVLGRSGRWCGRRPLRSPRGSALGALDVAAVGGIDDDLGAHDDVRRHQGAHAIVEQ